MKERKKEGAYVISLAAPAQSFSCWLAMAGASVKFVRMQSRKAVHHPVKVAAMRKHKVQVWGDRHLLRLTCDLFYV